jgi:transcriptional regulator with XRE-family HTH domain
MYPKPNLIQLRKNSQLTQGKVAEFLNITIRHYKALEAGTSDGSVKIWQQLAQKFNTTVDYLLQQEPTTQPNSNTDKEDVEVHEHPAVAAVPSEVSPGVVIEAEAAG